MEVIALVGQAAPEKVIVLFWLPITTRQMPLLMMAC